MKPVQDSRPSRSQATNIVGPIARWYARQRGSAPQLAEVRSAATRLTEALPAHADILEVAPGPGYLAVELSRRGFQVAALDISQSFVTMVADRARDAGVRVDVRQGDAALLPFDTESFDMIICQAAFKNFGRPTDVLDEMHRVLRPGGIAVIEDMNSEATTADIDREVGSMGLGRLASVMTKVPLMGLRRRAYSPAEFRRLADGSPFDTCDITTEGIGMAVRLTR